MDNKPSSFELAFLTFLWLSYVLILLSERLAMPSFPPCQLFGTLGCHLCEQAESLLLPWISQGLTLELIDISEHPTWFERYSLSIPVLRNSQNGAELFWPFDKNQLVNFLKIG